MQKEVFIAIFFGSLLGVLVAFGVWRANSALKQSSDDNQNSTSTMQPKDQNNYDINDIEESNLILQKPNERQAFSEDSAILSGMTNSFSLLAVSSEEEDQLILPNNDGNFEHEVSLVGGVNDVFVFAFNEENVVSESLTLLYSSRLDSININSDDIEEVIEQRKEAVINPYVSYLGVITDITENSMQIQTDNGIKQLSISDDATYANVIEATEEINFEDLAIGDNIIAMGRVNENDVLDAQRILVSEKYTQKNRGAIIGNVNDISVTEISISDSQANEYKINLLRATDYYSKDSDEIFDITRSDIETGGKVFIIYVEDDEGELEARMVYLFDTEQVDVQ